jgi:cell division protein YceG involved in septum cleavage
VFSILLFALTDLLFLISFGTAASIPAVNKPAMQAQSTAGLPTTRAVIATITVDAGSMLARDIMPQLCNAFSLKESKVKSVLALARSELISAKVTDYRRMEGMIPPGQYAIHQGATLQDQVSEWVATSEDRYRRLLSFTKRTNTLTDSKRLVLASMVEAECLGGKYQTKVAAVFLNRLARHERLQSCPTAEYVLGYQRPYLFYSDIAVRSQYNTYKVRGLPVGAICSVSDASLSAAMGKSENDVLEYFFYDYVLDDIPFFSDYRLFRKQARVSRKRFDHTSSVQAHAKINKQALQQPGPTHLPPPAHSPNPGGQTTPKLLIESVGKVPA